MKKVYTCLIRDYLIEDSISAHTLTAQSLHSLDTDYAAIQEEYKMLQDSIKAYSDLI